jgi:hypothetical protein
MVRFTYRVSAVKIKCPEVSGSFPCPQTATVTVALRVSAPRTPLQPGKPISLTAAPLQNRVADPYENALAERMNRTIKEEFCSDSVLPSRRLAQLAVAEAVTLYNTYRPRLALGGKTPEKSTQIQIPVASDKRLPGLQLTSTYLRTLHRTLHNDNDYFRSKRWRVWTRLSAVSL